MASTGRTIYIAGAGIAGMTLALALAKFGATIVVASHDLVFVTELCRRAIVMDRGRVVADGTVATILGDRELLLRHGLA